MVGLTAFDFLQAHYTVTKGVGKINQGVVWVDLLLIGVCVCAVRRSGEAPWL